MTEILSEKSYAVDARYTNFYAGGGDVAWSPDGSAMYCLNGSEVTLVDVITGQLMKSFGTNVTDSPSRSEDDVEADIIACFALAMKADMLVTSHRSGLLRLWSLESGKCVQLWKSQHKGPVVKLKFSACGRLICSSGADSTLRIWDYAQSHCLGVLKDFTGPALVLAFHPNAGITEIYAASADNAIYCWNYVNKKLIRKMRGHLSQVTALSFEEDAMDKANILENNQQSRYLASVSRDKVLIIWQLDTGAQHKLIPMYEELVGVTYYLHGDSKATPNLVVACAQGNLKLVASSTGKISTLLESTNATNSEITMLLHCQKQQELAVVTAEQNIMIYKFAAKKTLTCVKQLIGHNDEILDLCYFGAADRFLAVATNSKNIKIYDTQTQMNCKILTGHKETVMSLTAVDNYLLSAGKDCSILLWQLYVSEDDDTTDFNLNIITRNDSSHTATIGCIAFGYNSASSFASVCQDGSLKVWQLKQEKNNQKETVSNFQIKYSVLAHEKEINCVVYAPNNKMLATASQDKTVKLWSAETQASLGTLRGHTRGVWCVRFSPTDQIVLSSSADCSIRIWSLATLGCLKRFEQECSILRAEFIDHGKFIVSAAADGLIKLWHIKSNACVQTLDEHTDRVWSLAVSARSGKHFYSGGADSKLTRWEDITNQCRSAQIDKRQELLQQEQVLQSLLQQRQHMQKAFVLALRLGKPKVSFNIVSQWVRQREADSAINSVIKQLHPDQRATLLEHVKAWSTNSRQCKIANLILRHLLTELIADPTASQRSGQLVEVVTPYVQRHFKRVHELNKELAFLDFIVKCM